MYRGALVRFEDASVGAVERRSAHVAVVFNKLDLVLPQGGAHLGLAKVEGELRVWNGAIESTPQRLPRRLSAWQLICRDTPVRASLPPRFSASGEVRLRLDFVNDEPLVVVGNRVTSRLARNHKQLTPPRQSADRQPRRRAYAGSGARH